MAELSTLARPYAKARLNTHESMSAGAVVRAIATSRSCRSDEGWRGS